MTDLTPKPETDPLLTALRELPPAIANDP